MRVQQKVNSFQRKIDKLLKYGMPTIAIGLSNPNREIITSLKKVRGLAHFKLVGPDSIKSIKDFPVIIDKNPEQRLTSMLVNGEVKGIIRGTLDDFKTIESYEKISGEKNKGFVMLMESPHANLFFLAPASNPEGWTRQERLAYATNIAGFMKPWNIKPKIAIFTAERTDTYERKKHIRDGITGMLNKTYEDAEWIVKKLTKQGLTAKNWTIDLNLAVDEGYNIIIPINGVVGNQIFRVLLFCGGKIFACPRMGVSHCYEDSSRIEKDFRSHVKWLVAWINSKKKQL